MLILILVYFLTDILGVPWNEMGAALLYFTFVVFDQPFARTDRESIYDRGNDIFNRSLRLKARHMGLSLNVC